MADGFSTLNDYMTIYHDRRRQAIRTLRLRYYGNTVSISMIFIYEEFRLLLESMRIPYRIRFLGDGDHVYFEFDHLMLAANANWVTPYDKYLI